jgi:hypothetical protein
MLRHSGKESPIVNESEHCMNVDEITGRQLGHHVRSNGAPVIAERFVPTRPGFPVPSQTTGNLQAEEMPPQTPGEVHRQFENFHGGIAAPAPGLRDEHGRIDAETEKGLV